MIRLGGTGSYEPGTVGTDESGTRVLAGRLPSSIISMDRDALRDAHHQGMAAFRRRLSRHRGEARGHEDHGAVSSVLPPLPSATLLNIGDAFNRSGRPLPGVHPPTTWRPYSFMERAVETRPVPRDPLDDDPRCPLPRSSMLTRRTCLPGPLFSRASTRRLPFPPACHYALPTPVVQSCEL